MMFAAQKTAGVKDLLGDSCTSPTMYVPGIYVYNYDHVVFL